MNQKILLNKILPHVIVILVFLVVSAVYFSPQLQGNITQQGDIVSSQAMTGEIVEFKEKTGKTYYWNNGMFSGMPWGLLNYSSNLNFTNKLTKVVQLGMKRPIGYFLGAMVCCYLCLVLLGVNHWLSAIGAVAFSLNTSHMVLWEAGHTNKVLVLTLFPLIVGGMLLSLRKKYLLGGSLFAVGISLCIYHNHIQMVYYLALLLGLFYLIYFIASIKEEKLSHLVRVSGILAITALLAAASNFGQLLSSKSYAEDTMRGAPILQKESVKEEAKSSSEVEGLEWEYAMRWSNGFADVLAILVPRVAGGSNAEEVGADSESGQLLRSNGAPAGSDGKYKAPMYWGPLPFTSGPAYLGALLLFLFCLSLFELKPTLRWGILGAFVLGLLLSMGKYTSWLNRPLFEYFPLFNKFRAPSSVLSVIPVLVVVSAFLGLQRILDKKNRSEAVRKIFIAGGITGGICLILALLGPGLFDFTGEGDSRYPESVREVFIATRKSLLQADAFRSLIFILLGGGLLWAYLKEKIRSKWMVYAGLGLLMVVDLWGIGRRYMDSDSFVSSDQYQNNFAMRPVDQQIKQLEPKGRGYYRVHDLSRDPFNSSFTSKHHNTIGGYHPAKLQRYQDLIDYYISKGNPQVLGMLNTKYIINREGKLQTNPGAFGNAWFVDSLVYVSTPNEEIETVGTLNLARQAVVLKEEFENALAGFAPGNGQGSIELVEYEPGRLVYKSNTTEENLALFSEVWYGSDKGWNIEIDGEPADLLRANYVLRALRVPAGEHEIVFTFKPVLSTLPKVVTIISSLLILLGFLGVAGWKGYQWITAEPEVVPAEKTSSKTLKPTVRTKKGKGKTPGKKKRPANKRMKKS